MKPKKIILLAFASAVLAAPVAGSSAEKSDPLMGAWTREDRPQPSLYIFTHKHYSIMGVTSEKPREDPPVATATAEQLRATYVSGFVANSGTYEVKDGVLTVRPSVAKAPSYMQPGSSASYRYEVKGNTLILTTNSAAGAATETVRLKRVE